MKALKDRAEELVARYRITDGSKFRLKQIDPEDTAHLEDPEQAKELLEKSVARLSDLQEKLYAQDRWSVLLVFQALDAAGKDGTIDHVLSGVNPQGCEVYSFKAPTQEDLDHDFLWRCMKRLPERGRIGIFNRSYYEEVLVVRVHPEFLAAQHLPKTLVTKRIWEERYQDINALESYLSRQGIVILKFFLHVSKDEQRRRFLSRLEEPSKNWKFSMADVEERAHWADYLRAYEDMIRATSAKHAPWYVVPADHKWFTRLVVSGAINSALDRLDVHFPEMDKGKRKELKRARLALEKEKRSS